MLVYYKYHGNIDENSVQYPNKNQIMINLGLQVNQ